MPRGPTVARRDPDRSAGALRQVSPPIWLDTRADPAQCRRGRRVLTGPACFVWCERLEAPASRKPRNNPMQRATEVGSSGDGGFGETRKTTPCSRAPEDRVIKSAEQPHAKAVATQDRGRGNPKNNPHAVRLPGARESKTAEQPQDLWTGRSNDPSSWGGQGRATTGCAPGAWSQERRTGVAEKTRNQPHAVGCNRYFPPFPTKACAPVDRLDGGLPVLMVRKIGCGTRLGRPQPSPSPLLRLALGGSHLMCGTQTQLRVGFLVHPVAWQPWPLGGRPCI